MNLTTFTITILAFVIIAQRLRACCLEDALARQGRQLDELEAISAEALNQRDEARLAHTHLSERAGAYLREATLLVAHNEYLKSLKKSDVLLDAGDIISGVEEYLAKGEEIV